MAADELLTVAQAAAFLGIRPSTLRHWIGARKIDVVKYGHGLVRIRRGVLDRYVASCTIKATRGGRDGRSHDARLLEGPGVGREDEPLAR